MSSPANTPSAKYSIVACHVLWREFCYFASLSRNVFDFQFLEKGLHDSPKVLHERLQAAIDAVPGEGFDAVLVGYGLCSNGIEGITARHIPLVFARGHDCITHLLGSKDRYQEHFDAHPGTYWFSPGWIDQGDMPGPERYEQDLASYVERYGEENAEYLMKMQEQWMQNYRRAAYVDLGFGDTQARRAYTAACAQWLGWDYAAIEGNATLMRDFVEGNWDSDRFLVVQPGESVHPTHDKHVIGTSSAKDG